jgi:hypothetical protein
MVFALTGAMWNVLATRKLGLSGLGATLFSLVAAAASAALSFRMGLALANAAGGVAQTVTSGSGSTPYEEQFSYQESLAARGDVAGALESYEAVIGERPDAVTPRLKAAELYARKGVDPRRAAMLLREVRELRAVTPRDALYASLRLVALYEGPLRDPGRALVELRRLIELHPDSEVAAGARTAIARIKAERAAEPNEG